MVHSSGCHWPASQLRRHKGGAEISSKMCNMSNSHGRARKARLGNLRSEGYDMGLAKGRGFSAKRSAGALPSRQRAVGGKQAIPKKCDIAMEGRFLLSQENFTRNLHGMQKNSKEICFW